MKIFTRMFKRAQAGLGLGLAAGLGLGFMAPSFEALSGASASQASSEIQEYIEESGELEAFPPTDWERVDRRPGILNSATEFPTGDNAAAYQELLKLESDVIHLESLDHDPRDKTE